MLPLVSIYVGGILTLLMAIFHTRFYILFNWKSNFAKISNVNARIIYTIHLALLLLFFMLGIISIVYAPELSKSVSLSKGLNLILTIFWLWRFLWQLTYLKRGKEQSSPARVIVLTIVFLLLFISYLIPVIIGFLK
jgi:hypothetical protein